MKYKVFSSDSMMQTLHERQAEYAAEVKDMTPEEELAYFRRNLHEKLARDGWTLVHEKPGVMRLRKAPLKRKRTPAK